MAACLIPRAWLVASVFKSTSLSSTPSPEHRDESGCIIRVLFLSQILTSIGDINWAWEWDASVARNDTPARGGISLVDALCG